MNTIVSEKYNILVIIVNRNCIFCLKNNLTFEYIHRIELIPKILCLLGPKIFVG